MNNFSRELSIMADNNVIIAYEGEDLVLDRSLSIDDRKGNYSNEKFDFLGYTFRPRGSTSISAKIITGKPRDTLLSQQQINQFIHELNIGFDKFQ
jgi:hypothetical protein